MSGDSAAGGLGVGKWGRLRAWGWSGGTVSSEVSWEASGKGLLVASIKWIDEGVKALATSAWRDVVGAKDTGNLWGELGAVLVEGKVAVGGVVWVDEGVVVGSRGFDKLWPWGWSWGGFLNSWGNLGSCGAGCLFDWEWLFFKDFFNEWGGVDTGGWDVIAFQDTETFLASGVLNGVGLAVRADVRVLTDPVASVIGFFTEDDFVLGSEGGSGTSVTGVEPLFFQDLGVFFFNELGEPSGENACQNDQSKHDCLLFVRL